MTQARIYQKGKNALQSGRFGTNQWTLDYVPAKAQSADPLMGWAGSAETQRQVSLKFASLDAAKAYADAKGLSYTVVPAAERVLKLQTYADNFR